MGKLKQKWTAEEEKALLAGIKKHGAGKWRIILNDSEFAPFLILLSNVDLKDKWRNLCCIDPNIKTIAPATPATASTQNALAVLPLRVCASSDAALNNSSHNSHEAKTPPRSGDMIFEALSMISDSEGADLNAIVTFIEKRYMVPQNIRQTVSKKLWKLVDQGKLEKVHNYYKVKSEFNASLGTIRKAVEISAHLVAEAEDKSYWADEAVKEAEMLSNLAEEADAMLQLTKEIYEKCSQGEKIVLA